MPGANYPAVPNQLLTAIRQWVANEAKKRHAQPREITFRRRDVREFTGLPNHIVKRGMRSLEDLEYVSVSRCRQGGSYRYRLAGRPPVANLMDGLTTPDELAAKWSTLAG